MRAPASCSLVVIDDALGFTDAERLTKMAEVFDAVASDSQVIILTCSPQRYAGVRCAQRIELSATVSDRPSLIDRSAVGTL